MRILFLAKTNPLKGGVERWLVDLTKGLRGKGHEVMVGLARGARFHDPEQYVCAHPLLREVAIFELDGRTGVYEGRMRALEKCLASTKPDVVVPVMLHEALYAAGHRRVAGQSFSMLYPVHELGIWVFRAIQECKSVIDGVGAVNRLILDYLSRQPGLSGLKLLHLPLGVEKPFEGRGKERQTGVFRLGYCGKLTTEQKRVSDLVPFCKKLDELGQHYKLRIAGSGPQQGMLREALKEQIRTDRIEFLGELTRQELYEEFYPNIDALLIMSEWETGPLVAWEAMLHGVAILTSRYRGLRSERVLKHGENCLAFPVGQPQEGAAQLVEYLATPKGVSSLAESGRRLAEQRYTSRHMIDRWDEAINAICRSTPASPTPDGYVGRKCTLAGHLEHILRRSFDRPMYHSGPHDEWPRYAEGHVPEHVNEAFQKQLDELEERTCASGSPS